ncbi:hypothetical protein BOX15_Mlig025816g1 [Macrostomum lignano]|uniref:Uncharacterized protein n=2 Tax=Macrostomum lignano TaxID=282301 RepID=A0A267FBP6_9PLAT|nr:hypothetical protein BOX15_Mlig025816g2 [Macrostomum lignano]PAA90633.1 hypothetical protein BOX15_Mlig025816g1 [Macrostomum lignano]
MHSVKYIILLTLLCLVSDSFSDTTEPFARFEYKLSFKGPYLTQKDGSIPFWEYGGHAIAGDSYIRLTPSMSGKQGHAWTKKLADFANFRLDIATRVSGVGRHGGDGLGIWFVDEKPDYNLPSVRVFGGASNWTGLAVLLDTYDNDGKNDNPKIGGFVSSNKALAWSHDTDGLDQDIGHCLRNYRNRPFPVRLRLQYLNKRLTLHVNNGVASEDSESDYELCFEKDNVELPGKGYFGVTASTGGVSDDMDVYSFVVHSLSVKGAADQSEAAIKASEEERKKYEQEYEEYSKKLRDQIDAIAKSHREAVEGQTGSGGDAGKPGDSAVEDEAARQYRQIWEEQSKIRASIHDVASAVANARHDLATSITEVTHSVDAVKRELADVKTAANAAAAGSNSKASGGSADAYAVKELRDILTRLADKVDHLTSRHSELSERVGRSVQLNQQNSGSQGDQASSTCATTYGLYCAILLQTAAFVCLGMFYLKRQDAAKKFY